MKSTHQKARVCANLPPFFLVRKFDRQRKMKKKTKNHHFTKHRNTVNLNSHTSTEQEISEDGTDYTIQTAATRDGKCWSTYIKIITGSITFMIKT